MTYYVLERKQMVMIQIYYDYVLKIKLKNIGRTNKRLMKKNAIVTYNSTIVQLLY